MLNRQSSSSKKCSPALATATANEERKKNKKKKQSPRRSPLLDLNNGNLSRNNSTSSSISSSMSIDAPKGCLRFFLSNSSSSSKTSPSLLNRHKNLSKISLPKSRPQNTSNPSSSSRSALFHTKENHNLLKSSSQKRVNAKTSVKSNLAIDLKQQERFSEPTEQNHHRPVIDNLTPVGKLVCGFGIDCVIDDNNKSAKQNSAASTNSARTKTPPVQASVSPEIQCGSSSIQISTTTTPSNFTCYGAGHVVSGVTDRRKCRPRGILTVGSSHSIESSAFDSSTTTSTNNNSRRTSLIPLPAEASVSWLLSPCHENDEDQNNGFRKSVDPVKHDFLPSSPSSLCKYSGTCSNSKKCNISATTDTSSTSGSRKKTTRITLLSPRTPPEFIGLTGLSFDEVVGRLDSTTTHNCKAVAQLEDREDSSFSIEYLGNGNVIQTPKSDDSLSSERRRTGQGLNGGNVVRPINKRHFDGSNLKTRWDPLGLSLKFANLNRSSSSSMENALESSQLRISWREGLVSRIYEMDELDCCCRWSLEDEEEESVVDLLGTRKKDDYDGDGLISPEFLEAKPKIDEEDQGKGNGKALLSTCAESICTDGGVLVTSTDSDWTLCYKNKLFQL